MDGRCLGFRSESSALSFIAASALLSTNLMADVAGSWNGLHGRFAVSQGT
jgi:hypothetical protein